MQTVWVDFQYSLCRVVLMVIGGNGLGSGGLGFQYSLCRVVLMVDLSDDQLDVLISLSVLALSSRFDGLVCPAARHAAASLSVLALSSRFDGRRQARVESVNGQCFSTRSVESF